MGVNIRWMKTSSDGGWQGDNPLDYAFPLLILQTTLILVVTRSLAFLFKPLRQPKVIAEIVGGIILGPSALGRNQSYMHHVFPSWSTPILESVASIGLLFFLFLVGLELDFNSIRRSGRRALSIAAAGISLPFISGIGVAVVLRKTVHGADKVGFPQFLVFMGVALSITAFPVLARILAELKLLTTHVGETAMAAAAFNDVAAWILLALAVALAGNGGGQHKSPLVSLWVLLSGVGFVIFMMVVIRPAMKWVGRRCSEGYICLTLAGVMVSGFMTDLIGIHSIFGAFVFGLTIPKGGEFAERLIERIEDFVSGLLLPLYFASSGLKTDVAKIRGLESWGLLGLVITTACAGKIVGTFLVALLCKMPPRDSLTLGLLMNTKGLVELIVLNIGNEKKVLNDEIFAILVLMALFTTFITTPTVMAVYNYKAGHSKRKLEDLKEQVWEQLRVVACVHGPSNVPSIINLMESTRSKWPVKLFIMHLVELTERSSSILLAQRARKNGLPFFNSKWHEHDPLAGYSQMGRVKVRPTTAISSLTTMHEDICHVAEEKRVAIIILPFHKQWILRRTETEDDVEENNVGHGWRGVNQRVLRDAPCSVGVLVDRGSLMSPKSNAQNVCVLYFGGPDDEEALELGGRMAEHPAVKVTLIRFVEEEEEYDWRRSKCKWGGEYIEKKVGSKSEIVEQVMEIGTSGGFHLIVVGKGHQFASTETQTQTQRQLPPPEHPELGPIGDILASSGKGFKSSVLVIQQHHLHVPHHHHQHQHQHQPSLSNLI